MVSPASRLRVLNAGCATVRSPPSLTYGVMFSVDIDADIDRQHVYQTWAKSVLIPWLFP